MIGVGLLQLSFRQLTRFQSRHLICREWRIEERHGFMIAAEQIRDQVQAVR